MFLALSLWISVLNYLPKKVNLINVTLKLKHKFCMRSEYVEATVHFVIFTNLPWKE